MSPPVPFASDRGFPFYNERGNQLALTNFPDTPPPMTFLREILQNSDDAGAKEMVIVFTPEALYVSNNGKSFNSDYSKVYRVEEGGGVTWGGGDIKRMMRINEELRKPENNDSPPVGKYNTGFQLFHRIADEVRFHYVQMKNPDGKIEIDDWDELEGLNGRWKSMLTQWEEYTSPATAWRTLEDKECKVPLFYDENDDEETRRKTGGVLFEFPWRRHCLSDCEDEKLADFVRTSKHRKNFLIIDDDVIRNMHQIAVALLPLHILALRRVEVVHLAFMDDSKFEMATMHLQRCKGELGLVTESRSKKLESKAPTTPEDRWEEFRKVFTSKEKITARETLAKSFLDIEGHVSNKGHDYDLSLYVLVDETTEIQEEHHVLTPVGAALNDFVPESKGMRFELSTRYKRGVVRALLPKFDAAKWLEEINEAVSGLGEDPQFKGFPLYSMLPLSDPCRFSIAGPAYDGDFLPKETRYELLKKDGKFDMNGTWNESVIRAMLRLNLELQGTAAQSDEFLRESLPINPALFSMTFIGRRLDEEDVGIEQNPCWTSPYMFDIDGSKRAPADLFVPRKQNGQFDQNVAAVCSALGLPVMREDIVKEIDRKSAHLHPEFLESLGKNDPSRNEILRPNLRGLITKALRTTKPEDLSHLTGKQKVALANLAQVFADEEDLCLFPDTKGELRKRSDFVDLPKALQPTRELFDSFPQPDPGLKIKPKDASNDVLLAQIDQKFGASEFSAGDSTLDLIQQFVSVLGKSKLSDDPTLLRYRFIPARWRDTIQLHRLPHRTVHSCPSGNTRRFSPYLPGAKGAQGRGRQKCPDCGVDLENAPYSEGAIGTAEGTRSTQIRFTLEPYWGEKQGLARDRRLGNPNILCAAEWPEKGEENLVDLPLNWLGKQLPLLDLGAHTANAGNIGAWNLKTSMVYVRETFVKKRQDSNELGENAALTESSGLASFLGKGEQDLTVDDWMKMLEFCSAIGTTTWPEKSREESILLPDSTGTYHPAKDFFLKVDEELAAFLSSASELKFRTLHPDVLKYIPTWNGRDKDPLPLETILTDCGVRPTIDVKTITTAVERLLKEKDLEKADVNLAKIFMNLVTTDLKNEVKGTTLANIAWVPVWHQADGSDRRKIAEVPLISSEFTRRWGEDRAHPILKRKDKSMKWLGCFSEDQIATLQAASGELEKLGIGHINGPSVECLVPIFQQPNAPPIGIDPEIDDEVIQAFEVMPPTHMRFRNAWKAVEDIRGVKYTSHGFVIKTLQACPDRRGIVDLNELAEPDQRILREFSPEGEYRPRSFVTGDDNEAEDGNNWIDLNIILHKEAEDLGWRDEFRNQLRGAVARKQAPVFWNEESSSGPILLIESPRMPESVETVLAEALVSKNHIPEFLNLKGQNKKLLGELLNQITFPDLKTVEKWPKHDLHRVAKGFFQRLMTIRFEHVKTAVDWNVFRGPLSHKLKGFELPFAIKRTEGFGFSKIDSNAYAFAVAEEGLIERILSKSEDIGLFVPVENKKAYGRPRDGITEFQTTEREEGALDSIERADFKKLMADLYVLSGIENTGLGPIRSAIKNVKGHEVNRLPTRNLYFQTIYLGPVVDNKNFIIKDHDVYWVAEEANLSDLRQIILELFGLEEKAIQRWREVLKAIGEDGAILPSSEWPVQLEKMEWVGFESDWENQKIRLKTPFFLSKSKRESLDKIKRAGECMICARKTPTSPNDDTVYEETTKAIFGNKHCPYHVNTSNGVRLDRATLNTFGNYLYVCPVHHHLMRKRCFQIRLSIQGDEGVDIKELRSKLKGKSKEEILEVVKQDGALTFHVYEKTNYNPVLEWHQHKTSEEIAKKLSRNGDEYLASLHEMIVAYLTAKGG